MSNHIKLLKNYILYFLTFLFVCLIGISNVFALDYYTTSADIQEYYDNFGSSLASVNSTYVPSLQASLSDNITTSSNSYGAFVVFNSPIPIIENHTYSLSISFIDKNNISLSSKPGLSIGTNQYYARSHYINSSYNCDTIISKVVNNSILQYTFIAHENTSYIGLPWTTIQTATQDYVFNYIVIDDLGSEGVSETTINNSLNNQTNIINNSINSSTNTIVDNSNQNRQAIIDNQNANNDALIENDNANTDRIIEDNKRNFNDCRDSINLFNKDTGEYGYTRYTTGQWIPVETHQYFSSDYISVDGSSSFYSNYARFPSSVVGVTFYNENKVFQSGYSLPSNHIIDIPNNIAYFRIAVKLISDNPSEITNLDTLYIAKGNRPITYEPFGEICVNKLDEQTNAINGLNDSLNDDDSSGATSEASDFFSSFSTNTFGLTSIVTAPLNLIQSLSSSSCSVLHLPLPYLNNKYLDLPCMTSIYQTYFGPFFTMYQTITYGIIAYWVIVRIFNQVKDFKNPEHDEIEVVDL